MTETAEAAGDRAVITAREIEELIPHRWPFLLVDRIVELDRASKRIVGIKNVSGTEWFFAGHFPGMPIMPGVLQVEALAQTMGIYVSKELGGMGGENAAGVGLFAGIDDCRFKRLVVPGDQLRLEVTMERVSRRFGKGHGRATVDGELSCEVTMSFIIAPREAIL